MNNSRTFFNGAIILIIFNILGKIIGAIYRIPLARILGGVGMGQYQLVFPIYCLILTLSTSGIPSSISKMVAEFNIKKEYGNSKKLLWISTLLLSFISVVGFIFVIFFAKNIASFQGNSDTYICFYGIAPAIIFVGVISAFRGFFQGNLKMTPTAISMLIEQVFKMIFGLVLANYFSRFSVTASVFGALVGITISEFASFLFLLIYYVVYRKKMRYFDSGNVIDNKKIRNRLLKLSIPITFGGLITPITAMVDSFLVINLLIFSGFSSISATGLLGLQAGVVEPLINLPVVISISVATALLPNISSLMAQNSNEKVNELIQKSFQISLCISIACALCYIIFGKQILFFLYGKSFEEYELLTATKLLFFGSANILFLSLVQITAGILNGLGKPNLTVKSLIIGCMFKIVLEVILVSVKQINIFGVTISAGICYFIVFTLNYRQIKKLTGIKIMEIYSKVAIQECFVCLFAFFGKQFFDIIFSESVSMFIAGTLTVTIFFVTYYVFFILNKSSYKLEKFNQIIEK